MTRRALLLPCAFLAAGCLVVWIGQTRPQKPKNAAHTARSELAPAATAAVRPPGIRRTSSRAPDPVTAGAEISRQLKWLAEAEKIPEFVGLVEEVMEKTPDAATLETLRELCQAGSLEIAPLVLAAGDAAKRRIQLQLYGAALAHPSSEIRALARLQILNLTGEEMTDPAQLDRWMASHAAELKDE